MSLLKNKIALVTGASRGIGAATLVEIGKKGIYVIGTGTSEKSIKSIFSLIQSQKIHGTAMILDVSKKSSIDNFFQKINFNKQMPNILINNAGITKDNLLIRMSEEEWNNVIEVNLSGIFRITKACIRYMIQSKWGRIINTGSVVGSSGNAGQVNYCSAKSGIIGFSKALAKELGSRNITVNVVSPGFIYSDMVKNILKNQNLSDKLIQSIPMSRIGNPKDIANAIVFLASESANYITGHTLHVNGGMFMA